MKKVRLAVLMMVVFGQWLATPAATAYQAAAKAAVCTGCHGPDGRSVVPTNPSLAGQHADYMLAALRAYNAGEREHGVPGKLSEEDMAALSAYFAGQAPAQSRVPPLGDAAAGAAKIEACVACHGEDGNSADPSIPRLAGQHAAYLAKALRAYRSGARSNPMMAPVLFEPLSDGDIDAIAAYFATQVPRATDGSD
jgi:cytochrome c553